MRSSLLPLLASLLSVSAADFLSPVDAARTFHVGDLELKWELVLAEPDIAQPVFLNWDAMGRLWVCEYRQYPAPAGLEPVSHDEFWRTVYDKVPPPPPQGARGADRISIHEDTNGDGTYDKHTVFADGLSLCTAVEHGYDGHYVLQPPYLLYYADTDHNDIPDGPPEVLLSGFGIEDSHSVANSLRWGPDGWLYGAHGSTVTSHLKRPADAKPVVNMIGQGVWRYHPHTKQVEVFAEGGGNTFGLEFDAQGRLFSGHNGGDTRGFHYTQGAYLRKGFEKHGQLSNPYAYGYFEAMASDKTERFTHNFIIYENGALGSKYEGKLFGIEPLQRRLVLSQRYPDGSTFGTRDLSRIVTCDDPWFRPVDIKAGPDGAIYVADFHEPEISHVKHRTGPVAKDTGRIWRLRGKELPSRATPAERDHPISSKQLHSANKTLRQLALSFLREKHFARKGYPNRQMPDPVPQNASLTEAETAVFLWNWMKGQPAYQDADLPVHELDHFWLQSAMDQRGFLVKQLSTPNAAIRNWAVRLLCDRKALSPDELEAFLKMAPTESDGEVRLQLAASTCRLPRECAWPILLDLLRHPEDAADPRIPLMLWWAMEDKLIEAENQIVSVFTKRNRALVKEVIAPRIFKRLAQTGTAASLQMYAFLLGQMIEPEEKASALDGLEAAYKGRPIPPLPPKLAEAIGWLGPQVSLPLRLKIGNPDAKSAALAALANPKYPDPDLAALLGVLADTRLPEALEPLLTRLTQQPKSLGPLSRQAIWPALQLFDEPRIAEAILASLSQTPPASEQPFNLLASRASWSRQLVDAVQAGQLDPKTIPLTVVRRLKQHRDPDLIARAEKLWPGTGSPTTAEMEKTIARLTNIAKAPGGDPYHGRDLFQSSCGACHRLHGDGGQIGPDLTSYQRDDLSAMLTAIVNPNAEIREGYENLTITTRDGRVLAGFLAEQDGQTLTLRGLDGRLSVLEKAALAEKTPTGASLMPEGLLQSFDEAQVRDLFAYLRSTQPLPPRRK